MLCSVWRGLDECIILSARIDSIYLYIASDIVELSLYTFI